MSSTLSVVAHKTSSSADANDSGTPPGLSEITSFLTDLSKQAAVSDAQPDNVGTQPAYTVTVSPKHDGGLLGSAQLAFDAANGVPLRIAEVPRAADLQGPGVGHIFVPENGDPLRKRRRLGSPPKASQ